MGQRIQAEIGCWYENLEQDCVFEVVSIDAQDGSIGIQYYDGEIDVLESDSFDYLVLKRIQQPEDWGGPYEMEVEDRFESDFMMLSEHASINDEFDSSSMQLLDDI